MGIVRRQSIQSSILIYIGFAIGALNMVVLFPKFLATDQVGLTRLLLEAQLLFASFCTFGSLTVVIKFFPFYHSFTKVEENDLPFLSGILCLVGFCLFFILGHVFEPYIIQKYSTKSALFKEYYFLIYPATFLWVLYTWLEAFTWSYKKTVIPAFLKESLVRLITTLLIVLFIFNWIEFRAFILLFSLIYLIPCIVLIKVLVATDWKINMKISKCTYRLKTMLFKFLYTSFGIGVLNMVARTADTFLIAGMIGLGDAALYQVATYIVSTMEVPSRGMIAISSPIIAENWKTGNIKNIRHIYHKSALTLFIAGMYIFGLIWINLNNLTDFLPHQYAIVGNIIFLLSITKLIDLGTGLNGYVLAYSNFRLVELYSNIFFSVIALPLNYFLIKQYGLLGAAISNMISLTLYNMIRFSFLWKKFELQPFTLKNFYALWIGIICIALIYFIPRYPNIYIDTFFRSGLFTGLYLATIIIFNISEDINHIVLGNFYKIKKMILK